MATNGGRIDYTIGFKTDKSGLKEAQSALQELKASFTADDLFKIDPAKFNHNLDNAEKELIKIKNDITQVQSAFSNAFNTTTGQMNLAKLSSSFKQLNLNNIYNSFSQLGEKGQQAFYKMTKAALTTNTQFIKTRGILDKMGDSLLKTAGWSISSSLINRFTGSIQQAYGYVQHLDTSLNDIRIVTGKSADEMDRFAEKANTAAQALGKSTTEYTEAALIYYQQGLSDEETAARTETTLKAASVTGQSAKAVSEQLTSVWNGYKVTAEGTEEAVDKLAAVAATTAADLEELSTGMSKVASAANSMGINMDQLNATIATIESVTRQAPESVGTALKTIYARMGDLKLGETDEDGLKLGDVSSTLQKVGIEILDVNGELRDMGVIIEEIGEKWGTWTKAQQTAIAESVAGKRQYNNLFALFDNWDMYTEALETSRSATGTLQKQQDIYMESTAAHIQKLKTEWEDLYDSVLDTDTINNILDGLTNVLKLFTNFIDSIGGGGNALLLLGSTFTKVFHNQIGKEIGNLIINMRSAKDQAQELTAQMQLINLFKNSQGMEVTGAKELVDAYSQISQYYDILDEQSIKQANALAEQVGEAARLKKEFEEIASLANEYTNTNMGTTDFDIVNNASKEGQTGFSENLEGDISLLTETDKQLNNIKNDLESINNATEYTEKELDSVVTAVNNKLSETSEEWKALIGRVDDSTVLLFTSLREVTDEIYNNVEMMSEGFKNANPEFEHIQSIIEKIHQSNNKTDFASGILELEKALEQAGPKGQEFLVKLRSIENQAYETSQSFDSASQALNRFLQDKAIQQFSANLTQTIGSIGQFASGLLAIKNVGKIFNNDDLTTGEKILQLTSSLGMAFTMLLSNLGNIAKGFSQFQTLTSTVTLALFELTEKTTAAAIAKETLSKFTEEEIIALYGEQVAQNFANKALTKDNILLVLNNKFKKENITLTALLSKTISTALVSALSKLKTVLLSTKGIIVLLTAAVLGVIKAYKSFQIEAAKARQEQANIDLKITEDNLKTIDEYKDKVEELTQSYKNLKEQVNSHEISLDSLKTQIYDLANKYNIQIDAVKLLSASYEELDDIIKQVHNDAANAQFTAQQNVIQQRANKLAAGGEVYSQENKTILKDWIQGVGNLQLSWYDDTGMMDWAGDVDWDKFYSASVDEQDRFINFLKEYEKVNSRAKDAYKYIIENIDELNTLRNERNNNKTTTAENLYEELFDETKNLTVESINTLKEQMTEELKNQLQISYDEALQLATDEINKHENLITVNASVELATQLAPSWDQDINSLAEKIQSLSLEDIKFLSDNQTLASTYNNLDDFLKHFEDTREFLNKKENILAVHVALTNTDGKEFKIEDIDALFETNFGEDNNITKEQFLSLDYKQQQQALLDYYIIANQQSTQHKEIAIQNLQQQKQAIEENKQALIEFSQAYSDRDLTSATGENSYLNNQIQTLKEEIDELTLRRGELSLTEEDLRQATLEYSQGIIDVTDERIKKILELKAAQGVAYDDVIKQIERLGELEKVQRDYTKATKQFNKEGKSFSELSEDLVHNLSQLDSQQKEIESSTEDWSNVLQVAQDKMEDINSSIDSLQGAYKSLTSIIEEYNETGILSMDNLQALLSMDTQYLSALQIENGQMSLNEEALKQIALARLDEAEATAYEEAMAELNTIAQNGTAEATRNAGAATVATAGNIRDCITALREGAAAWDSYWSSVENGKGAHNDETKAVGDALKNKLTAIDKVRNQIKSGDISFNTTMSGHSTDSSKNSGGSSKEPEQKEHEERDTDIYRSINKELEQIEATLGRIQKINDHEWGIDAQKTLEEENKLLDEQLGKLEEKKALQEQDLSIRRKQLEDIGVSFTADGSAMTNAEAKLNQLYAQYNSMIDHYNSLSVEGQEAYKAELEAEKKKIDAIEKKMDEYERGFSDYQSTLDKILDTHYEAIANEVNQFNNMVDIHLELKDAEKEWNDFWKEVVQDVEDTDFAGQIIASIKQLNILVGTVLDNANSKVGELTRHVQDIVTEVQSQISSANRGGEDSIFGDDTALAKENLTKYRDALMDALREANEEVDNISENYLKMLDDAQDKIDAQVEGWESISDQIEHDVELIKLISGDKAFDALNKQYEHQYQNDLRLIDTQKQSQDFWKQQIARYQNLVEITDKNTKEWKTYEEALKKSVENYRKATQDLDKVVQDSIKDLQEWRTNNVKSIEDVLDKAMSGGLGLDTVEEEWKLINDYADQYFDNVERAFNMEEYTNILNDAANAIGLSAENQEKLNQFREQELAQLNAKNKLTQYDIDESRARLEILKAEMALQDTQRNKSNLRLRRDSQGNYSYQYVGNEAEEDKAENGLLTAKREWYELVKKRNKETNEYIIQLGRDRIRLQQELADAQAQGDIERADMILKMIQENEKQQVLAYEWAEDAKQDLILGTAQYFAQVEEHDVLPMWNTTINKMVDRWANDDDSFIKASITAIKNLQAVQDEYARRTQEVLEEAGINYDNLRENGIDPTRESLEELAGSNEELADMLEEVNELLTDQEGYLHDAEAAYNALKDAAVDAISAANAALNALANTAIQTIQQVQAAIAAANQAESFMNSARNSAITGAGGNTGGSIGNALRNLGNNNNRNAYVTPNGVGGYKLVVDGVTKEYWGGQGYGNNMSNDDEALRYFKRKYQNYNISYRGYDYKRYDTGGYTGSWGKDGRLAVLHQKELVLNQDDTTNILKAVEAIRQVVSTSSLGGSLLNASMTSSNMLSRISAGVLQGMNSFNTNSSNATTNMVINADFSGVRSADEIYQALLELQNYGLQENYSVAPHINIGY